jgi:hypothetical protein
MICYLAPSARISRTATLVRNAAYSCLFSCGHLRAASVAVHHKSVTISYWRSRILSSNAFEILVHPEISNTVGFRVFTLWLKRVLS